MDLQQRTRGLPYQIRAQGSPQNGGEDQPKSRISGIELKKPARLNSNANSPSVGRLLKSLFPLSQQNRHGALHRSDVRKIVVRIRLLIFLVRN